MESETMSKGTVFSLYEIIKKVNVVCTTVAGGILLFVNFAIFIDVFLRYVFNRPSIWVTEVSTYLFLYMIFFATSYTLQQDLHIRVTFLRYRWSEKANCIVDVICSIFAMLFCSVLLWQTTLMTWSAFKENWTSPTMLNAPYAYIYLVMVFGSFLLLLTFLLKTIVSFREYKTVRSRGEDG
jgi:TRAP-type C4-dicarboxylate transport system permease small subunit